MPEYIVLSTVPMESLEELIRCKDCKFSSPNPRVQSIHQYICDWHDMTVFGHYYCGSAEKRKENDNQG